MATLVGRTPGLSSPEIDSEVERSLVSELHTYSKIEAGNANHDPLPADNETIYKYGMSTKSTPSPASIYLSDPFSRNRNVGEAGSARIKLFGAQIYKIGTSESEFSQRKR